MTPLYHHDALYTSSKSPSSNSQNSLHAEAKAREPRSTKQYTPSSPPYLRHPFSVPSASPNTELFVLKSFRSYHDNSVSVDLNGAHSGYHKPSAPSGYIPPRYGKRLSRVDDIRTEYTLRKSTTGPNPLSTFSNQPEIKGYNSGGPGECFCAESVRDKYDLESAPSMPPTPVESTPPTIAIASPGHNFLVFDFDEDLNTQDYSGIHPYAHPAHLASLESLATSSNWDLIEELEEIAEDVKQLGIPSCPDSRRFALIGPRPGNTRMKYDTSSTSSDQPSLWTNLPGSKYRLKLRKNRSSH